MLITEVWSKQPGKWFCLATLKKAGRLKKEEKEKPRVYWFKRMQFPKVGEKIDELKADKLNVYFCPHGFTDKRRIKENAVAPHLLFADLDETPPSSCRVEPTWAVMSSPGRYVGLWATDDAVTEEDNRRWTYTIGADKTGWDFGQILRVPGTRNYKYDDAPRVRVIGGSGKTSRLRDLRKLMPTEKPQDLATGDKRQRLYSKYEKKLKPATRRLLFATKTNGEDRSKTLWRLNLDLIEAGASRDEAFTLLWSSVWNKFAERRDGEKQLKKELNKSVGGKMANSKSAPVPGLLGKTMAEVEEEDVDWIWFPYLARRELTIIEGDPGVGKSWLIQMVAKHLCDNEPLPGPKPNKPIKRKPCTVVFFDYENDSATVMKARLKANGMVHFERFLQEDRTLTMMDEDHQTAVMERLAELEPDLVVFDTLVNYMGGVDGNAGISVSTALQSFIGIAKQFSCSVVVLRHLKKDNSGEKAIYRGQGSITFTGTARICISVGWSPDDPDERLFAVNKLNLAKVPVTRSYRLNEIPGKDVAKFEWGEERSDITADQLMKIGKMIEVTDDGCQKWLEEFLTNNPKVDASDVLMAAQRMNFLDKDLKKAAKALNVEKKSKGFGKKKHTIWWLPESD